MKVGNGYYMNIGMHYPAQDYINVGRTVAAREYKVNQSIFIRYEQPENNRLVGQKV